MTKDRVKIFLNLFKIIIVLFLVTTLILIGGTIFNHNHNKITITVSAVGDCTLGKNDMMSYKNTWGDLYTKFGADYFLKNCRHIFLNDDLTIANLEGVISDTQKKQEKYYKESIGQNKEKRIFHLGKPCYIKALADSGIDVVGFANNHNIDYGIEGFENTVNNCQKFNLPIAYYDNVVRYDVKGLKVGVIAVDATYSSQNSAERYLRNGIADLRRDCNLIIAMMHWGKNYKKYPNKEQQYLGHLCIDLGADMVVGHHAHILQGVERYKGRYIFYSLGNFTYGGRAVPKDIDTIIAQQTFTFVDGKLKIDDNVKIYPSWMSTKKNVNDYCPVIKNVFSGFGIIRKINKRSKPFDVEFNVFGKPKLNPEKNTSRVFCEDKYIPHKINKVPDIIYRLLNIS